MCKEIQKKLFAIVLAIVIMGFGLTACGGNNQTSGTDNRIVGTWEMTEITAGTEKVSAEDYMHSADVNQVPVLTFEGDGAVTLKVDGDSGKGIWAEENGTYSITYHTDGNEITKSLKTDGATLTMEQDGYTLTYEKK